MTELSSLVAYLYAIPTCAMGGPLHIVTDDGNCRDSDLNFCRDEVTGGQHWSIVEATPEEREQIAILSFSIIAALRPLSEDEREAAIEAAYP